MGSTPLSKGHVAERFCRAQRWEGALSFLPGGLGLLSALGFSHKSFPNSANASFPETQGVIEVLGTPLRGRAPGGR